MSQFFYSPETRAIWRQTWRLTLLAIAWRISHMHDIKLNGCRQRLLFARQLTQWKCSLCVQGTSIRLSVGFIRSARVRQSSLRSWRYLQLIHCGQAWISLGKSPSKDILFLCPPYSSGPYISRSFLIWTHFVNASSRKIGPTHAHFQYNARKLMLLKSIRRLCKERFSRNSLFASNFMYSFQIFALTLFLAIPTEFS